MLLAKLDRVKVGSWVAVDNFAMISIGGVKPGRMSRQDKMRMAVSNLKTTFPGKVITVEAAIIELVGPDPMLKVADDAELRGIKSISKYLPRAQALVSASARRKAIITSTTRYS